MHELELYKNPEERKFLETFVWERQSVSWNLIKCNSGPDSSIKEVPCLKPYLKLLYSIQRNSSLWVCIRCSGCCYQWAASCSQPEGFFYRATTSVGRRARMGAWSIMLLVLVSVGNIVLLWGAVLVVSVVCACRTLIAAVWNQSTHGQKEVWVGTLVLCVLNFHVQSVDQLLWQVFSWFFSNPLCRLLRCDLEFG